MDDWNEKVASFADDIDKSIECNDIDSLSQLRDELKKIITDDSETPEIIKSILTYYLSNIYQHLAEGKNEIWKNSDYGNTIICHRKFYRYRNKNYKL